ncbi:hypothetical protein NDU88_004192 [Pleurodeles waltl]|uniref:Uncharacterized protein n=1 Tax=Pleurodeles waltl TaxID=8319 RepID=A0AAV7TQR9_PLEWA|nr:hypothetical protein NDU88_004192 [Pleurodeles waltl]
MSLPGGNGSEPRRPVKKSNHHVAADRKNIQMRAVLFLPARHLGMHFFVPNVACPAPPGCCPDCLRGLLGAEEACCACVSFPSAEEVASIRRELSRAEPPSRISRAI